MPKITHPDEWSDLSGNKFSVEYELFMHTLLKLGIGYRGASDVTEEVMGDYWPEQVEANVLDHAIVISGVAFYFDLHDKYVGCTDFEGHWSPRLAS